MVPPREFHKGAARHWVYGQCRRLWGEVAPRDRRDPDSQPNLASGLFGGEKTKQCRDGGTGQLALGGPEWRV